MVQSTDKVIALHHCADCQNRGVPIDLIYAEIGDLLGPQCSEDGECDDGLSCNGAETCNAGSCQQGQPLGCPDGQVCDETAEGVCIPFPCPDIIRKGSCNEEAYCGWGTPDCSSATGNPHKGVCCNLPFGSSGCSDNAECDDGLWCNGEETCIEGSCQPGSDPCPGADCDEAANTCTSPPPSTCGDKVEGQRCQKDHQCQSCNCVGKICVAPPPPP